MSSLGVPAASRATSSTTPNSRSSRPSSPASTPTIARIAQENNARKHLVDQNVPVVVEKNVTVGLLDEATLAKILPPWRIALRRGLAKSLELEMPILEAIQVSLYIVVGLSSMPGARDSCGLEADPTTLLLAE